MYVDSGSPLSCTSAELVSWLGCAALASSLGVADSVPAVTRPSAATAATTRLLSICRVVRLLQFISCPPETPIRADSVKWGLLWETAPASGRRRGANVARRSLRRQALQSLWRLRGSRRYNGPAVRGMYVRSRVARLVRQCAQQ